MSVIADPYDGEALRQSLKDFDGIPFADGQFGRLRFKVDCADMTTREAFEFVERLNDADTTVNVFVDVDNCVEFDYYITEDLIPYFRGIVDEFTGTYYRGKLIRWEYVE